MDPVKLLIFASAAGAFLFLTKKLFASESVPDSMYHPAQLPPQPYVEAAGGFTSAKRPARVGSDLPYPTGLPPREIGPDGEYNRPEIANYYFRTIDLADGPEDRDCFCDEFYVEFVLPETATPEHRAVSWTSEYIVATPAGLAKRLRSGNHHSLAWNGMTIIVSSWDIGGLLRTIVEEAMQKDKD